MSAEHTAAPRIATASGSMTAFYFLSGTHQLFAWLHQPSGPPADMGVVLCKPFGYEALCGYRAMRAFADTAAALGMPVMRFDALGTGDSADIDPAADQLASWVQDVHAAIAELRQRSGVRRVCLLGFRLGALVATLAAARGAAVDALILVAPVSSGRRYLRELRTTLLAAALGAAEPGAAAADDPLAPGSMEVSGYVLSAATIAQLSQIDLTQLAAAPASAALVIDRSDLPQARALSDTLTRLGVQASYTAQPGFVEMMLTAPQFAANPQGMLSAANEWLLLQRRDAVAAAVSDANNLPAETTLNLARSAAAPGPSERPVLVSAALGLFGIVAEPAPNEVRRRAVVLLNAGADYHIGASRMYVSFARRWAARGYVVLRMDLAGLGDSAARPGEPDNRIFAPTVLEDVQLAIEFIRQRYGVRDLTLAGLCSAAYHVLRAAVAGLPINRILMVNPQNFSWKESMELGDLQLADVVKEVRGYRERALSLGTWKRLVSGQIDVPAVARVYLHHLRMGVETSLRELARRLHIRLPRDLGHELEEVAGRGIRVVFVFARGDPGVELLRLQGGAAVERLGDRCRVHIIDDADHTFTRSRPRMLLEQVLSEELFARHG
jgi:alpha-beta hydrolase superfamily lysophospholipase